MIRAIDGHKTTRCPGKLRNRTIPAMVLYQPVTLSGVQASDQHKRPSGRAQQHEHQFKSRSGVQTDSVCAGQRLASGGRVPLSPSRDSE